MRSIFVDLGSDVVAGTSINARVEDVRLAVALLVGAASAAEAEIASSGVAGRAATHWSPEALAAAGPLGKIIASCNAFEAAITAPAHMPSATTRASIAAVSAAHMPSPATLATIAAVEAVSATMPSAATRATIATVEAAQQAVSRQLKG